MIGFQNEQAKKGMNPPPDLYSARKISATSKELLIILPYPFKGEEGKEIEKEGEQRTGVEALGGTPLAFLPLKGKHSSPSLPFL